MPRKVRVQYIDMMYQVVSLGDQPDDILSDDADRNDFIKTLPEACQQTGWQINAFCLIRNQYPLVVVSRSGRSV
jgi:hypothetical protein